MGIDDEGVGGDGAGDAPAGHENEDDLDETTVQPPIGALYFDPFDRAYLQNADLTMVESTGPIQRAAHLILPLGNITPTRSSGFDVNAVRRATPERRAKAIRDALERTWKPLLEGRQITMGDVVLLDAYDRPLRDSTSSAWRGRFEVPVTDVATRRTAAVRGRLA